MTSVALPLSAGGITSSQKGHFVGQAELALVAAVLAVPNNLPVIVQ